MLRHGAIQSDMKWASELGLEDRMPSYSTPLGVMFNEDSLKLLNFTTPMMPP